jgi:hypothetical protein
MSSPTSERHKDLCRLVTLNEALRRRDMDPLFEYEVAKLLTDEQLKTAIALTREAVVESVRTLREG